MNEVMKCIYDRRSIRHFAAETLEEDIIEEIV